MRYRNIASVLVAGVVAGMWAGCMDRDVAPIEPVSQTIVMGEVIETVTKVDILVMVDRSPTMDDEQAALAEHFPTLIRELMAPTAGRFFPVTDLRIGVVSQDLGSNGVVLRSCEHGLWSYDGGDRGCLLKGPPRVTCAGMADRRWLERNDGTPWYSLDDMARDFGCIAQLGPNGCGIEQQIESVRMALVERSAPGECNEGFLRPDSVLGIVLISDEEECSVNYDPEVRGWRIFDPPAITPDLHPQMNLRCYFNQELLIPVNRFVDGLNALRGPDAPPTVVAMIVGVPEVAACETRGDTIAGCLLHGDMPYRPGRDSGTVAPACTRTMPDGSINEASPGRRFVEAAQMLGDRALVRSICNADWRPAMAAVLDLIQGAGQVCFPRALELDLETEVDPEVCVADCNVVEVLTDARPCPAGREPDPDRETEGPSNALRRRCIIPQATRQLVDGVCGAPQTSGWYYVPAGQGEIEGCHQVLITDDIELGQGSIRRVECLARL